MIIGIPMGQEICLILGQVSLDLFYWKKNLLMDTCGPGERLTRKQLTSRPDLMARNLENNGMRGIYFIDPEDKEFKETIKNARKKLETSVAPAMLCKIMKRNKNCGSGASNKIKSKLACILEANGSTRMRMGNSILHHHEDHVAGRGNNSLQHYNLVQNFSSASSYEHSSSKGSSGQGMGEIGENFGVELDESQKQERGDR